MSLKKLNIIVGWAVFAVASIVYLMTIEPTASFWDCGEFIATAYNLEVGHPPGAPFFMILARFFMMFSPGQDAAFMANVLSAFCSSFTILFLFWTITAFAKKMTNLKGNATVNKDNQTNTESDSSNYSWAQTIAIIGSGLVGALAYTFSDSFWFSAVEGEVYAMSSLFTAVVFWAVLKYDEESRTAPDKKSAYRWLILIAYLMGLSIGVHLLNLLAIPAIALVYYLRNYSFNFKGLAITGIVSLAVLVFIQSGIIPGIVGMACGYEIYFTNNLGMPFNYGSMIMFLFGMGLIGSLLLHSHAPSQTSKILIGVFALLLLIPILSNDYQSGSAKFWITILMIMVSSLGFLIKKPSANLNASTLSLLVILIGYSTFALIVIRSSANPPMDENNPENQLTLLSYLNREQYGDRPLSHGQYFNAQEKTKANGLADRLDGKPVFFKSFSIYNKNKAEKRKEQDRIRSFNNSFEANNYVENNADMVIVEEYIISDPKKDAIRQFEEKFTTVFPRMYSDQPNHIDQYISWSGAREMDLYAAKKDRNGKKVRDQRGNTVYDKSRPKNPPSFGDNWAFFVRYQINWMYWRYFMWNFAGRQNDLQGHGSLFDGNWLSGIDMVDERRLGDQSNLPSSMTRNKGYNKFYFIPLILGIIGLFYHLYRDHKNWLVVFLLFLLTGLAIVVYLNQYPMQPRERDYAFVGSFYAFAIWIGLGVFALFDSIKHLDYKKLGIAGIIALGFIVIVAIRDTGVADSNYFLSFSFLLLSVICLGLIALMLSVGGKNPDSPLNAYLATAIGLMAPIIMLHQGWDDHNRSHRRTAVDFASNYLESCEENAILFTNGDNDTFPLWYAQEVEGIRQDVRVMNLSLSNTDWYIDQMKRKAYTSDPVPFSMPEEKYRQGTRDVCFVEEHSTLESYAKRFKDNSFMKFPEGYDKETLQKASKNKYLELKEAIDFVSDDRNRISINGGEYLHYIPTRTMRLTLDKEDLKSKGLITEADSSIVPDYLEWKIPANLLKNNLMMLDMLAHFNWERPVYYAVTTGPDAYINLDPYFELEGLAYRLTPKKHPKSQNPNMLGGVNTERMYDILMNKFKWGNMDVEGIYMDENNLRMTTNIRLHMANLAEKLIEEEKEDKAKNVLDMAFTKMPEENVPFNQVVIPLIDGYYSIGEDEIANELAFQLLQQYKEDLLYYTSLEPEFAVQAIQEVEIAQRGALSRIKMMVNTFYPQSEEVLSKFNDELEVTDRAYQQYLQELEEYSRKNRKKRNSRIQF